MVPKVVGSIPIVRPKQESASADFFIFNFTTSLCRGMPFLRFLKFLEGDGQDYPYDIRDAVQLFAVLGLRQFSLQD